MMVAGLSIEELSERIDSLRDEPAGIFDSFEALVRYTETKGTSGKQFPVTDIGFRKGVASDESNRLTKSQHPPD